MAELERYLKSLETKLAHCCNPALWNPFPIDIKMSHEPWLNDRKYSPHVLIALPSQTT